MAAPYPPYVYPPAFYAAKLDTKKGLSNLQINLVFDVVFSSLAIVVGLSGLMAIGSGFTGSPSTLLFGALLCGAFAGLAIIFVINFIINLLSIFAMRDGAAEFGYEHENNVSRGFIFKWLGTVMSILAVTSIIALTIFSISSFYLSSGGIPSQIYVPVIISVFWTIGVSFKALMYVYMVKAIAPPEKAALLTAGFWSVVIVGILAISVIGAGTISLITQILEATSPQQAILSAQGYPALLAGVFLAPGFAIVGYVLFLIVYMATAKAVREGRVMPRIGRPMPLAPTYHAGEGPPPQPAEPWKPPPEPPSD